MTLQEQFTGVILNGFKGQTIIDFVDALKDADEDLRWLECLESAGVDNWSGIDFAVELLGNRDDEDDDE